MKNERQLYIFQKKLKLLQINLSELGPWSKWSECSATCGGGQQQRTRECGLPNTERSDNPCKKPLFEINECNTLPCPSFGPWTEWSPCSVTCGGGNQTRSRECLPPKESGSKSERIKELYCEGKSLQSQVLEANTLKFFMHY